MYNMSEFRWRLFHAQVDLVCIFQPREVECEIQEGFRAEASNAQAD